MDKSTNDKNSNTNEYFHGKQVEQIEKENTNCSNNQSPKLIKIPRSRNESASSDDKNGNDRNSVTPDGKRQKPTDSASSPIAMAMFPNGVPASPPRFVSLEEIMKAANGVENMVLAHEIAVDNNFRLEKTESPPNRY